MATLIAYFSVVVLHGVCVEDFHISEIFHVAMFANFFPKNFVVNFKKKISYPLLDRNVQYPSIFNAIIFVLANCVGKSRK